MGTGRPSQAKPAARPPLPAADWRDPLPSKPGLEQPGVASRIQKSTITQLGPKPGWGGPGASYGGGGPSYIGGGGGGGPGGGSMYKSLVSSKPPKEAAFSVICDKSRGF